MDCRSVCVFHKCSIICMSGRVVAGVYERLQEWVRGCRSGEGIAGVDERLQELMRDCMCG